MSLQIYFSEIYMRYTYVRTHSAPAAVDLFRSLYNAYIIAVHATHMQSRGSSYQAIGIIDNDR